MNTQDSSFPNHPIKCGNREKSILFSKFNNCSRSYVLFFLVTTKQVTSLSQTHAQTRTLLKTQAYTQQHHFASHWRTHLSTNSV